MNSSAASTQSKLLTYVQRSPLGVVAQITVRGSTKQLNFLSFGSSSSHSANPLLIATKEVAPALQPRCKTIGAASKLAPISVLEFAELIAEAGVPPGVLTFLPGMGSTTGKEIVQNLFIRKVDSTAGTKTGRSVGNIVSGSLASFTAKLGGKVDSILSFAGWEPKKTLLHWAPIVIFNDTDLISAANGTAFAAFVASGQTCISGTRILGLIQNDIYDTFMSLFNEKVEYMKCRMGDPLNPKSTMGSVIPTDRLKLSDS